MWSIFSKIITTTIIEGHKKLATFALTLFNNCYKAKQWNRKKQMLSYSKFHLKMHFYKVLNYFYQAKKAFYVIMIVSKEIKLFFRWHNFLLFWCLVFLCVLFSQLFLSFSFASWHAGWHCPPPPWGHGNDARPMLNVSKNQFFDF